MRRGRPKKALKEKRTARLNLMVAPRLRKAIHEYADKRSTSISTLITDYFVALLAREESPDVEQI